MIFKSIIENKNQTMYDQKKSFFQLFINSIIEKLQQNANSAVSVMNDGHEAVSTCVSEDICSSFMDMDYFEESLEREKEEELSSYKKVKLRDLFPVNFLSEK